MDKQTPRTPGPSYPSPVSRSPGSQQARESQVTALRVTTIVCVIGFVLFLMIMPEVIRQLSYSYNLGKEQAEVEAAVDGLRQISNAMGEEEMAAIVPVMANALHLVPQAVEPSVVHIQTSHMLGNRRGDEAMYLFDPPRMRQSSEQGSGVIVDPEGYIVTNNHVVEGATDIRVHLMDGREVSARVVGTDPLTDLAVLKTRADNLVAADWGDSERLRVGDPVWAMGSPFGLDRTVTFGIVSAKGRRNITGGAYQDFLQTDAAVNPGNSGGPLVNLQGKIVGINTAIVGQSYQGISFAIPSAIARDVYERLKEHGRVPRGYLGVALQPIDNRIAAQFGLADTDGAFVVDVMPNSPASKAGIEAGDVIVRFNDVVTDDPTTLSRAVGATEIGSEAIVVVERDGEPVTLDVTVGERPD